MKFSLNYQHLVPDYVKNKKHLSKPKKRKGYIQTDEGWVNTQYQSNTKQKMGTYAVNIYGWLMCKLTAPQRTIES
jgi:hypothetical protein